MVVLIDAASHVLICAKEVLVAKRSEAPPAYTSAVSKKFTPASRQRAYSSAEVASSASPPNDMVPKHSSETRMPVPPRKS